MRTKIIAGNWKMFTTVDEGISLVNELIKLLAETKLNNTVIIIPPYTHLREIFNLTTSHEAIHVGAQNVWHEKEGAFTGEISVDMLKSTGAKYVIIGHSERRQYFKESNELLAKKVNAALMGDLNPIYCCGENLDERESGKHFEVVESQVKEGLFHLTPDQLLKTVIAYEPVWAIGTGKTATPEQAQEIHSFIRKLIKDQYGDTVSNQIQILYGGSVKPNNAAELFSQNDIDGGLVGGASLKAQDFVGIINAV